MSAPEPCADAPLLLDLFCCQGGASAGYVRAGFAVVGVDIAPQPRYPYPFVQADALGYLDELVATGAITRFKAIHASAPCQEYSNLRSLKTHTFPDLVVPTRERLRAIERAFGIPWVMENVVGAPMEQATLVCGTALGLPVRRHRLFDCSILLSPPGPCRHSRDDINVYGHNAWNYHPRGPERAHWTRTNAQQTPVKIAAARAAFEIDWMNRYGLAESIPPAYTAWVGAQLLQALANGAEEVA